MLSRIFTATTIGLQPLRIDVEVDGNRGLPGLVFIGLPSKAITEAKERITAALQNCGIRIRSKRTIINLAPADIPKTGTCFDLAIAIGLLKMYNEISVTTDDAMFFGELALDGRLKKIHGALPLVLFAKQKGFRHVFLPQENINDVETITGISIHPFTHLQNILTTFRYHQNLPTLQSIPFLPEQSIAENDFSTIAGQDHAKRALTLAIAGRHNILLTGPPGSGKTLLAQASASLLPPLSEEEALEVTRMYSLCGLHEKGLVTRRPFRTPHHTISLKGFIGGGNNLRPGEISLAHHGVLFLDELFEFPQHILETLRQPLESGEIAITRSTGTCVYPANFTLIAATNSCPCGYLHSVTKACSCSPDTLATYRKRLSGPLLDRIDLRVIVREVEKEKIMEKKERQVTPNTYSQEIATAECFRLQRHQQKNNAKLTQKEIERYCILSASAQKLLHSAFSSLSLSMRGYHKIIKVSRTIADIQQKEIIQEEHVAEALQFR